MKSLDEAVEAVVRALFRETTTIGCRLLRVEKRALERVEIDGAIKKAATAVEMVIGQGVQKAMNQFNRRRDKEEDADGKGEEGEEKNGEE